MKKIMIFIMMLVALTSLGAYTIETSRGQIELNLPDGMTYEDGFVQMAKLYLEERFDHEDLLEKSNELTKSVDTYVKENKELREKYDTLEKSYDNLIRLYEQKTKVKFLQPLMGAHLGTDSNFNSYSLGLDFGAIVYDKFFAYTSVSYPWQIVLGIDFKI